MSVLQVTCVVKVKLVEVLIITYIPAVHQQWKWHTCTQKKNSTKTQTPPKIASFLTVREGQHHWKTL